MGEIRVRKLNDEVITLWRERAARNGRSLVAELREFITNEAARPRRELFEQLRALREGIRAESGELPDSTPGIRAARDALG